MIQWLCSRRKLITSRVMSICLGRPFAAQDEDCLCALPVNCSDERILAFCVDQQGPIGQTIEDQPLTGFLAFSRLCCIAGRCESLDSPSRIRDLHSSDPSKVRRYIFKARACDKDLHAWLESLPDEFRFSANALDTDYSRSPGFTMCVVAFIVHGGSLLKMYRCVATYNGLVRTPLKIMLGLLLLHLQDRYLLTRESTQQP